MHAHQGFQLFDEGGGFLFRDEFGGLDGVHQEFQFRQLKGAGGDAVEVGFSAFFPDDVQAETAQLLEIRIESFSIRADAPGGQAVDDLLRGEPVAVIRFLHEDFCQKKQFQLLIVSLCHGAFLPFSLVYGIL